MYIMRLSVAVNVLLSLSASINAAGSSSGHVTYHDGERDDFYETSNQVVRQYIRQATNDKEGFINEKIVEELKREINVPRTTTVTAREQISTLTKLHLALCSTLTTCEDCLNHQECDAWSAGRCFPTCSDGPMDVSCWTQKYFDLTPEDICEKAKNDNDGGIGEEILAS